jgi:26S proteasome non-ATPase regulatory subunit 10
VPLVKLLLSRGAKVNAKDGQGSTPLHRAASAGRQEAVRALLEAPDLKIDAADKQGATPLFVAVSCQAANIALLLAAKGANLEVGGVEGVGGWRG